MPLRFLAYFCLSLAIVLLSGFLETTKIVSAEKKAVFWTRHAQPVKELTAQEYRNRCGEIAVRADDPAAKHYLSRLEDAYLIPVSRTDWENIRKNVFSGRDEKLCFSKKNVVSAVSVEVSDDPLVTVKLEVLGSTDKPEKYPLVDINDLARHQALQSFLLEIDQLPDGESRSRLGNKPVDIDLQEWKLFTDSMPDLYFPKSSFIFGDHLYSARVGTIQQRHGEEIPGLRQKLMSAGIVLLGAGLFLMFRLYRAAKEIKYVSNRQIFVLDSIVIAILAVLGFMGMDHLFAERFGTSSILGAEGLLGVFSYVPVILGMTAFVSWKSARAILIDENGILDSDLIMQTFMPWNELSSIELMEDVEMSGRRRSYKVLFMHAADGNSLSISGNIASALKTKIKSLLLQHVPESRKPEMQRLLGSL